MTAKDVFRTANADFDHPLEMLAACHDRIEERCALLHRICEHIREVGVDTQVRQAAENVMRYFDTAGENHHRDEEEDLFPQLLEADREACEGLISRLRQEHHQMREAWAALRARLSSIAAGESATLEANEVERFATLYRGHIELEERELLPAAERLLDAPALRAAGEAMARRRGVRR